MRVTLPGLHPGQQAVARDPARFKILACGRRWGKTRLGVMLCAQAALGGGRAWWVAPSWSIVQVGWRGLKQLCRQVPDVQIKESLKTIEFPNLGPDAAITVKSGEEPEHLRGEGLDLLVIDESAFLRKEAWIEALRPALSDKLGRALLISTPKSRNWFYDEFSRGRDPLEKDYACWQMPSHSNPFFPAEEWEVAKRNLPEDVFRQEYEAEFLVDSSSVFRGVQDILSHGSCSHAGPFVIGADIAKHTDFTVLMAMCKECGSCREVDRFQKVDWTLQKTRIAMMSEKYNKAIVYLDASGVGDPIYDDLKMQGVRVEGLKLALARKTELIQKLIVDIEQKRISYPSEWEVVTDELQRYEYRYSAHGNVSYGAPDGYNDDCVIALGLCNWGRRRGRAWVAA